MKTDRVAVEIADLDTSLVSARITDITTMAISVPLTQRFVGSRYSMTYRSTIITQIHAGCEVVGVAYAGDEDATLEEIDAIIRRAIKPRPNIRSGPVASTPPVPNWRGES